MVNVFAHVDQAVMDQFALDETGPITYDPRVSAPNRSPFQTRGIFDRDHELIFTEVANSEYSAAGHSTFGPVVAVRPSELGLVPKQGDRVTIKGTLYRVHDVKTDGPDWTDLVLKEHIA